MDEFVAVPAYAVFLPVIFAVVLALRLTGGCVSRGRREYVPLQLATLVTVMLMARNWSSMVFVVVATVLLFYLQDRWRSSHPWRLALLLSGIALAVAFLPYLPNSGALVNLEAGDTSLLVVHLRPILFLIAINLIVLSPSLYKGVGRMYRLPRFSSFIWSMGFIVAAFVLGWALGGIDFIPEKAGSILRLPLGEQLLLLAAVMGHALMVAAIEESFFRGVLIPSLARLVPSLSVSDVNLSMPVVLSTSSLLFGVAHLHLGLAWVLGAFLAGIGYGMLYLASRGVIAPILVHAAVVLVLTTFFSV